MANRAMLARLAEAVADGNAIDWEEYQSDPASDDPVIVEQLRVLATISTIHRSTESIDARALGQQEPPPVDRASARQWGPLLILSDLGEGSQGRVYRALDQQLQREVALKVVRHPGNAASAALLVAEARLLARIRHPNVVTVYGADRIGDEMGLWMELVEGRTLAALVATDGPLGGDEAALVGATLSRALAAVHQAGLLHRDIKAQNVVREAGGRLVLMDFGAGRDLLEPSPRRVIGTPAYLAPEVLAGGPASVQSDIYSLGVLLFFLTTRRFPVMGANIDELWRCHQRGQVTLLRDLRPNLPEPFVAAVARALSGNPRDRFESAGRFEEALNQRSLVGSSAALPVAASEESGRSRPPVARRARVAAAVTAVLVVLALSGAWLWPRLTPGIADMPSIAVLPLRNLSGDAAKEYLADSLTDVLITHLTKIQGVRVLSFPAVAAFKGQSKTPGEVGSALGVRYLLAGAIVLDGTTIRTTVQLIDTRTGATLWADEYTRGPGGLLEQQAEITKTIASRLRIDLAGNVADSLQPRAVMSAEAQDAYFRGIAAALQAPAGKGPAPPVEFFEQAVKLAPNFGEAWAALSLARIVLANQTPGPDRASQLVQARSDALKAVEIDPRLGTAHAALGSIRFFHDWDWNGAEDSFRRAIDLTPGDAFIRQRYATVLAGAGRLDEAVAWAESGQAIEPLHPTRRTTLATIYHYARRYDEAIREANHALEVSPRFAAAHYRLCIIYATLGKLDTAASECDATIKAGNRLNGLLELARVHALAGRRKEAERALDTVRQLPEGAFVNPDNFALVYAALGDTDRAFSLLEEALVRKAGNMLWIRVDSRFDALRKDPRFVPLVNRVGGIGR